MPMRSWLMEVCSNSPAKRELNEVCQPEDGCHLLREEDRPRKEDIEKMCLNGFLTKYEAPCIYREEDDYEDIDRFQELGYNFKFHFQCDSPGRMYTVFLILKPPFPAMSWCISHTVLSCHLSYSI